MTTLFDRTRLRTVHLVPLTAYRSDGRLNLELQAKHIARMSQAGIRCFLPAAGTSEFHSLTPDEVVELVKVTREAAGAEAVIFAPVGLQQSVACDVGERSLAVGADGVMFMPFVHPYLSDAGAKDYYQTVMDRLDCPVMFYKKSPLPSDELLLELVTDPRVVGVKYAVNQMHQFRKVVLADHQHTPEGNTEWLCGSAERFAPYYLLAGSHGYTTGAGNLCPQLTLAMHTAFASGATDEGMRYQELLLPIEDFRAREGDSFNISLLKFGMSLLGDDFGQPRPPQRRMTSQDEAEAREMLSPILQREQEMVKEMSQLGL